MKSKDNIVTEGFSGKIRQLVFRQWYGQTIIGKRPRHSATTSAAQLNIQSTFKDAAVYAKAAITDPATKQAYKAKAKPGQTAYNLALADFFNAPAIGDIDTSNYSNQAGSSIRIAVTDDFKVAAVTVTIENNNRLVEQGPATLTSDGLHWLYNATVFNAVAGNSITVTATDLPGHSITKQKTV